MKKIICVMIGVACLGSVAMGESRLGPFVSGIAAVGDESGSAFGAGVKYEWLFNENFGLDLRGGYINDGDIGLIPLTFGPVAVIPLDPLALTLSAGGLYGIPTDGDADSELGFYAAAGLRGPVSGNMEWFAELQYSYVKGDDKETTTYYGWGYRTVSEEHLDFSGIGLNIGVLWKF